MTKDRLAALQAVSNEFCDFSKDSATKRPKNDGIASHTNAHSHIHKREWRSGVNEAIVETSFGSVQKCCKKMSYRCYYIGVQLDGVTYLSIQIYFTLEC